MSSSLTLCNNKEPFLDRIVMCDEKLILCDNQWWLAQWLDHEETPKHFPKPNSHPQKRLWSLFGGILTVCPRQLSESWWNHYIWELCSANRWDAPKTAMPTAGIGQQKGPNSSPRQRATTQRTSASEVEQIGLWSFASSTIFTWPFANHLPLLQASRQSFCKEDASTTSRRQKMLSKSSSNPEAWIFTLQE